MREILFRGKDIDGKWVQGYCIKDEMDENKVYIGYIFGSDGRQPHDTDVVMVDPETVCQYTGLTDKNGGKIFEGDICRDSDNIVRILWNDKHQWGVEISKTDNVLSRGLVFPLWQYDNCKENGHRTLEVIGNIFDNPDLIGE